MDPFEDEIAWNDGFVPSGGGNGDNTKLVRYRDKAAKSFLCVYDDVLTEEVRELIYSSGGAKPWGVYVPLASIDVTSAEDDIRAAREGAQLALARIATREIFCCRAAGIVGTDLHHRAHGVAVWCLASGPGASVEYHIDYAELHRYETNEIVPPIFAATYHATKASLEGGDFFVNTRGLDHYMERGYKAAVDPSDRGWVKVPYCANRAIVHDGEYPHYSSRIDTISPGDSKRVILGFNVFSSRVKHVNERAPEHSPQFNNTVKLYQAAAKNRIPRSPLSLHNVKADKRLARFLVGLARSHLDASSRAHGTIQTSPATQIAPGDRVLARWRTGLRLWPATIMSVQANALLVDLRYDDGFQWQAAPASVVARTVLS